MTTILLPLRNVNFSLPLLFDEIYQDLADGVLAEMAGCINRKLDEFVTRELGRDAYERCRHVQGLCLCRCQKCGGRWRPWFTRNGYRSRGLDLVIGRVQIDLPRVKCRCGGSVRLNLPDLQPGQRLGPDVAALVEHWAGLAYSLRDMKRELDEAMWTSVGLRSLSCRLRRWAALVPYWQTALLKDVPPVVMLDGVWITLMQASRRRRRDKLGRRRVVKQRVKLPVLIALGVWPEEGRSRVLDWEIATEAAEDRDNWLRLLNRLEERGLAPHQGLTLFIHDGGSGLIAALTELFPDVPRQRCVFHKLRNLAHALTLPSGLAPHDKRDYGRQIITQAARIWQAPTLDEAYQRHRLFCRQWQAEQPELVMTLQRDFEDTLTFYRVWDQHRLWPKHYLRTTSLLERLNRLIRARMRKAGAYHSLTGLQSMLAQVLLSP